MNAFNEYSTYKKERKGQQFGPKNTLPLCFMGFCLQRSQEVYLPVWNYLFIKQQNNEQTILCHIIIIIIISRYNKINKINYILINKINHHKINVVEVKF